MISIVITAYKEPKTIGKAISSFTKQKVKNYELIISAPDKETLDVAKEYSKKNKRIKVLKDKGKGKPAALNQIFKKAKGKILILSDGDVYVSKNSIKSLLKHLEDPKVGGVTGRVLPINSRKKLFGFWAHILTESFHDLRTIKSKKKENIICSGYLYAIRKGLVKKVPENILADDAFISLSINKKGYTTAYEPKARVFVKYPTNLQDWIRQKKRTAARFYQLKHKFSLSKATSFKEEAMVGINSISKIKEPREIFWFEVLVWMRLYIWFRVFFDFRLWKRQFGSVWERVESTK